MAIRYAQTLAQVDWEEMKQRLAADDFDNGRSPIQLQASFVASYAACVAYDDQDHIIGTARALSDGVCNAYIVDVWTYSPFRHQGIARQMMTLLQAQLPGQHVALFTDTKAALFYHKLGYMAEEMGMSLVVGRWLDDASEVS